MSSGESCFLGEALKYIKRTTSIPTVFDVGANIGRWSSFAISNLNTFSLHVFEPNVSLKEELANSIKVMMAMAKPNAEAHVNMLGVGIRGKKTLYVSKNSNELATTVLNSGKPVYGDYDKLEIELIGGSDYCKAKKIDKIDYLKIDTEGSELAALKSFGAYLQKGRIKFIQFEYGKSSLYGGSMLNSFFDVLGSQYSIHRIFPEGITEQLQYSEKLEAFGWSNYLAIHRDNLDLLDQFLQQSPLV